MEGSEIVDILAVKNHLRFRLCRSRNDTKTFGYNEEKKYLKELMQRCISHGESESILVIGPRGSGKTKLLNNILEEVSDNKKHRFRTIHLNGFLLTDDKIALHEIARQLELEACSLKNFSSFQESLIFLLGSAFSGPQKVPLIFVLDEFDAFLQHKNQTLLYNLLDTMNNFEASICIVGLSSRMDVTELFEKRVKSRFSHRQIHLCLNLNFEQYMNAIVNFLSLSECNFPKNFIDEWNCKLESLCREQTLVNLAKKLYNCDNSLRTLQMFLLYPITQLSHHQPNLEAKDFIFSYKSVYADNAKSNVLQGLSNLELSLVVAAANLRNRYNEETFNFEMAYNEYKSFCERKLLNLSQEKSVVFKAFENLLALELINPVENTNEKVRKDYWLMISSVHVSELGESLAKIPNCPAQIKQWVT